MDNNTQDKIEAYNAESGLESKAFNPKEIEYAAIQQQINEAKEKKRKSPFYIVGKIILYFVLLPIITSLIYIRSSDGSDNPLTEDIPFIAKVIAVFLWVLLFISGLGWLWLT
ncbi:MAG: hypothetical protein Q7S53_01295 [bacterium]|nr:hypothetical protein [bacterium]